MRLGFESKRAKKEKKRKKKLALNEPGNELSTCGIPRKAVLKSKQKLLFLGAQALFVVVA